MSVVLSCLAAKKRAACGARTSSYLRRPSFSISARYLLMSVRARYCSSRLRRPTSSSSPRRLWWSCLCTLRCSVRSAIRLVSSATWTSGEPVSPSLVACPAIISFFTVVLSGTLLLLARLIAYDALAGPMWPYKGIGYAPLPRAVPPRLVSRLRAQLTRPDAPADALGYHAVVAAGTSLTGPTPGPCVRVIQKLPSPPHSPLARRFWAVADCVRSLRLDRLRLSVHDGR